MTLETREQLRQLLGRCDPSRPLPATDEKFYVPRSNTFREIVREHLLSNSEARELVSGQSGVGKSTELARLAQELSNQFYVLRPPIDLYLDLEVMNWQDIIVFSALYLASERIRMGDVELVEKLGIDETALFLCLIQALCKLAQGNDVTEESPILEAWEAGEFYEELEELEEIINQKPSELKEIMANLDKVKLLFQTSFGAVHENLLKNSRRAIQLSAVMFQVASGNSLRSLLEVSGLDLTTGELEPEVQISIVTIIDGTEKLSLDQAVQLFYRQGRVATQFPSRLVVVVSLEVCYEESYEQIREQFTTHQFLRAIACQGNDAVARRGKEFFKSMVVQRLGDLPENLVDWAAIGKAIDHSAGIPRQFLMILQHAVQVAILEGFSTVNDYCVSRGIEKARERFYYQLGKKDKRVLSEFARTKEWGNELRHLHRLTCIVEVENGGIQRILNPLCKPFLEG